MVIVSYSRNFEHVLPTGVSSWDIKNKSDEEFAGANMSVKQPVKEIRMSVTLTKKISIKWGSLSKSYVDTPRKRVILYFISCTSATHYGKLKKNCFEFYSVML